MKHHFLLPVLIAFLTPLALLFLALRLLLTPLFLEIEYRMPGFPPDTYGFTRDERLHYARLALQYLLNDAPRSFLGDLKFSDGSPLYTQRELDHMDDVRRVVRFSLWTGRGCLTILILLGLLAARQKTWPVYRRGLRLGGWLTITLVTLLGIGAAISFWQFFTLFHVLFFEGDSWLFYYSDTLIRLFPMRFWQDAFLFAGLLTLGSGIFLILANHPRHESKCPKSNVAQG